MRWFVSLLLCGVSAAIAFNGDVLNLGIDGQLYMGAISCTAVAIYFSDLPRAVLIPLCILFSMLAGALWSCLAAYLNIKFGANIVVLTLMLNYIAVLFTSWCVLYPMHSDIGAAAKATIPISENAMLNPIIRGTQLTSSIFIAIVVLLFTYVWIVRSRSGFEIKLMGHNAKFASVVGIDVKRKKMILMCVSGAVAGLCGGLEILALHHRFAINFISGMGFNGMVVAMLVNNSIAFLPIGALFMGALQSGSSALEMFSGIPRSMVTILMGIIVMFVTVKKKVVGGKYFFKKDKKIV